MKTFEEASQRLAESLPNYERREPQDRMASFIEDRFDDGRHGLVEAGCGVGKSLGYLIPAILSGKRTIISTATKALQEQISQKDLPFLEKHLGVPFQHAVLKGRSNYLCLAQMERAALDDPEVAERVKVVLQSRRNENDVEPDDFLAEEKDFGLDPMLWRNLTTTADNCAGKQCPFYDRCYSNKAKERAAKADVVVVNHALFLTDLKIRAMTEGYANMIGEYHSVIFDEGHEVEEYATTIWSTESSIRTYEALVTEIRGFSRDVRNGDLPEYEPKIMGAATVLFDRLPESGRLTKNMILDLDNEFIALHDVIEEARVLVCEIECDTTQQKARKARLERRLANLRNIIENTLIGDFSLLVRYMEMQTRGKNVVKTICTAPIDVAPILRELLWKNKQGFLVSATLSVDKKFDFIAGRLGIDSYEGLDVGTPFDYQTQSMLYVPRDIADPGFKTRATWESQSIEQTKMLLAASNGRALLLFTSNKQMRAAYDVIAPGSQYACYMQGQAPNADLAAKFMEDTHSVLFATRSFFTGVDFQGDACSLVVIDKLVFDAPDDPIIEARCDLIKARGGNPFSQYSVPKMCLVLNQGFGRLIRHRNDRGVVAILDPRILTKGYGKTVLRSLPNAPLATQPQQVKHFYEEAA